MSLRASALQSNVLAPAECVVSFVQAKDTVSNAVEQVKTFLTGETGDYQPEVSAKQVSHQKS